MLELLWPDMLQYLGSTCLEAFHMYSHAWHTQAPLLIYGMCFWLSIP